MDTIGSYWSIGDGGFTDYSICKGPLLFEIQRRATVNGPDELDDAPNIISVTIELSRDSWQHNELFLTELNHLDSTISRIAIKGVVHDVFVGEFWDQCLRWSIGTIFDYGGTGIVVGSLDYGLTECSQGGDTNYTVPLGVIALAIASIVLCTRAELLRTNRHGYWYFFNMCTNFVQIAAGMSCMRLTHRMDISIRFSLIGLCAILTWICVIRYLRYFHIYYALIRTLSRALPKCMRFVTGVSPLLIGYALLGNCLFYQSQMFSTIPGSIATLFSLLNGDIIRDTFSDVEQLVPYWGHVYLYSFLCLFIYVVLHIFISIVEEAYFNAKMEYENDGGFPDGGSDAGDESAIAGGGYVVTRENWSGLGGGFEMSMHGGDVLTPLVSSTPHATPSTISTYILDRLLSDIQMLSAADASEWKRTHREKIINYIAQL
jgi:hypothetical protein